MIKETRSWLPLWRDRHEMQPVYRKVAANNIVLHKNKIKEYT